MHILAIKPLKYQAKPKIFNLFPNFDRFFRAKVFPDTDLNYVTHKCLRSRSSKRFQTIFLALEPLLRHN